MMALPAAKQPARPQLKLVTPGCHDSGADRPAAQTAQLTVALVGQPNVGKSTVFNMLTGLNQHVGNWPGKTVEQKTGVFRANGASLSLVDLPGTYSLTANSEEERIARDYLIRTRPDVVLAVVNAAILERSLYLVAELLALGLPLVIGLNMLDVAEQHGLHVEPHVLAAALGVPVIPLVASKNQGVKELVDAALAVAADPAAQTANRPTIRPEHRPVLEAVEAILRHAAGGADGNVAQAGSMCYMPARSTTDAHAAGGAAPLAGENAAVAGRRPTVGIFGAAAHVAGATSRDENWNAESLPRSFGHDADTADNADRLRFHPRPPRSPRPGLGAATQTDIRPVADANRMSLAGYPPAWVALKLLEGDAEITALVRADLPPAAWGQIHAHLLAHEDAYLDIAGGRYEWIGRMARAAVTQPRAGAITRTERLDRVATHPLLGMGLLLAMFGLVFWFTYTVAAPITDWLGGVVLAGLATGVGALLAGAPAWLSGFFVDGLLGGAGTVLTFLPILVIFFAALGVLEDTGYLARGAYVMDRFMHMMGLHGKSFLPLFLGFGCNVPAVLGARILEDRRARLLTILLAPLVPCTARLAVLAFLAPAFFGAQAALVSWGLVALNLLVLAVAGIVVNRLAFRGEQTAFIMELPLYHVPNPRTVGLYVWNNTLSFVRKAGSLILIASAVVWLLSAVPGGAIETSLLARFGRWLTPIGGWMGLADWRILVALLTSFFAKENTIATLGILFGGGAGTGLAAQVALVLTPAARWAFLIAQMLFIPCLATVATIKQETASWRWTIASVALLLALSLGAAALVYQVGTLVAGG